MIGNFPRRDHPVMTIKTATGDISVIKTGSFPANGLMTIIAIIATGNMPRILAFSDNAIVAIETVTIDCDMIDAKYIFPNTGTMT